MTDPSQPTKMSDLVAPELPFLRRHARALTGRQDSGDRQAAATLEAILADPSCFDASRGGKAGLFRVFHSIWTSIDAPDAVSGDPLRAQATQHLATLTPNSREALLLHTVEGFSIDDLAFVMGIDAAEADALVETARAEMQKSVSGRVLIIEDEAIIAMDLEGILSMMGHEVTGVARTRDAAVEMGRKQQPDLILADIQLADNSSGIDAVKTLLPELDVPVIFITAFPERLLTGDRPEPTFLIAKPYEPDQVVGAVSQAMFFASTATLGA
ncbi:response regulator receiver protein [Aliiruegeria haliotis]|uniref:Response regulator receiver protein n=1 Tax=Aliiruegeria haliotis TaxID=1280846 RepID=A0A2T0RPL2_9RHOB|nr:response regulator [Aliiruegeria haliotis]PRY23126.1 response regulator receiver protein [Aliiruegeria haliotis]